MEKKNLFDGPKGVLRCKKLTIQLLIILSVLCSSVTTATAAGQSIKFEAKMSNVNVSRVLDYIASNSDYAVLYDDALVASLPAVTINSGNIEMKDALDICFKGSNVAYTITNKTIVLSKTAAQQPKKVTVKGKILDSAKKPVVGATIIVLGTANGAISDEKGAFSITVNEGNELEVSFVGFLTQKIKVTAANPNLVVELKDDAMKVEDVVVVGYGTTTVRDFTGSVARIGAKEIGVKNVAGASALMQNVAAGVQVSQATGRPGETSRIRVRGATSLTGSNDPLYVIDGIPTDDAAMFDAIPTSDISSIDVLKDASASAIYGSRAANGVVLVTTKKGSLDKKATFNVDYTASYDTQIKNFDMLDGDQFRSYLTGLAAQTLVYEPDNKTAALILDPNSGIMGNANSDWFGMVKQPAWRHNFNVSASGGSKSISYYISTSIQDQKGMVAGDDLTRYVGRVNLDANIGKMFKIGTNLSATYTDQNTSGTSMFGAQGYRPDVEVYDANGEFLMTGTSAHPLANSKKNDNRDNYRFFGTIYGELEIIKNLKLKSSLSANQNMNYRYTFEPSFLSTRGEAVASRTDANGFSTIWDNTLSYNRLFGNHSIDALVGVSFENSESQSLSLSKKGYALDEIFTNVTAGTSYNYSSDSKTGSGLLSTFFRANYKYKDKYLATFTARYDGSSMFGKNNRYGFFPSGALAWRINQESFLKDVTAIDDIKLKVSAGRTGVQNMTSYSNRDLYETAIYNGQPGIKHSQLGNPDIAWEQSTLYDVAVDYAFFGHRLSGSFGYYRKDTDGLIWSYNFPSSMAVGAMNRNIGSVRNEGLEFNVRGVIVDTKDFYFSLGLNISHNKNLVTKLEKDGAFTSYNGTIIQGTGSSQVLAEGYPMGSFLGYEYNGIIQNKNEVNALNAYAQYHGKSYYDGSKLYPGMLLYKDLNLDGTIDTKDQTIIGSPDPDLYGGIMAQLKYKSLSLDLDFGFQIGGKKIYGKALQNVPAQLTGLVDYNLYNVWSPINTSSDIPVRYLEQGVMRNSKLSIYDASYFRLQNIRVSYDIPKWNKANIRPTVFISASNVFTITSYPGTDPATIGSNSNYGGNYESSYPGIRTFSFGAKLNF